MGRNRYHDRLLSDFSSLSFIGRQWKHVDDGGKIPLTAILTQIWSKLPKSHLHGNREKETARHYP